MKRAQVMANSLLADANATKNATENGVNILTNVRTMKIAECRESVSICMGQHCRSDNVIVTSDGPENSATKVKLIGRNRKHIRYSIGAFECLFQSQA